MRAFILFYIVICLPGTIGQQFHWQPQQCPTDCGLPASTVVCVDSETEQAVEDINCDMPTKPNCEPTPPCVTHQWKLGDEACCDECGHAAAVVTRTLVCLETTPSNPAGTIVGNSLCDAQTAPDTALHCPPTQSCAPFWFTSDVLCPTGCGLLASTLTRNVLCKNTVEDVVIDVAESFCDASTKPSTIVNCSATPPCAPFWLASDVQCQDGCGQLASTISRSVSCKGTVNGLIIVVADSWCPGSKPSNSVSCPATPACGCSRSAVSCTADVQCCSGRCRNAVCAKVPKLQSQRDSVPNSAAAAADNTRNIGLGVGLGIGGAAALVAVCIIRRRLQSKRGPAKDATEPLTPHAVASPRRVDVVA